MKKNLLYTLYAVIFVLQGITTSGLAMAAVPAPPVIQMQGIPDGVFNDMTEPVCRNCHNQNPPAGVPVDTTYLPDRHHLNMGATIPGITAVPNPDPDGDGIPNFTYECLTCHSVTWDPIAMIFDFVLDRDCLNCHKQTAETTVHHLTQLAADQDCMACHGGLINNPGDGHYIPTYQPYITTPWPSGKPNGDDTIVNTAGTSPGNCNFCHNTVDGQPGDPAANLETTWFGTMVAVYPNMETHHATGLAVGNSTRCAWCHDAAAPTGYAIRQCEACHGVSTLHNIVADSDGDANVIPGQEPAGYGHTGTLSDCWGCHGNNGTILAAPNAVAAIPGLHSLDRSTIVAGGDTMLTLAGMNFTNYVQNPWTGNYDLSVSSVIRLTDSLGNATDLVPTNVTEDNIEVVVPSTVLPGNYQITAAKGPSSSNPMNLSVTPAVLITYAECSRSTKVLTVIGSGFGSYLSASGSGTSVEMNGETGTVIFWSDSEITAEFSSCTNNAMATVYSVFDSASASVRQTR